MPDFNDDPDDFEEDSSPRTNQAMSRLRMALTRWWLILVFAAVGYCVGLYTLSIAEPSHQATAVFEVVTKQRKLVGDELERDQLAVDKTLSTIASKMIGPAQLVMVANSATVQSIENAIPPAFSLKPKYWRSAEELSFQSAAETTPSDLAGMIARSVKVEPRRNTTLIDVTVTHKDRDAAIAIADAIMDAYLEAEDVRKTGGASDAFKVLRAEAEAASGELETAQRAMETYKSVIATNVELKQKRDELVLQRQRYKAKHPKMIQATAMHNELKQRFRREILSVSQIASEREFWESYREQMQKYDQVIANADQQGLAVAADASEEITRAIEEARSGWLSLVQGALSARAGALQARITNKQALYDTVTQRIMEIDVAEENNDGKIKIAERAYPSDSHAADKTMRLAQGLAGGAILGFGIAYLLGMIDFKIYDVRTLEEASGLPCLAAIPSGKVFDLADEWVNVLDAEPNSADAEAVRNLRASVMLLGKAERHQTILISSSIPGEGKTTLASELAAAFALNGQKTILVDFDLRKPRVHTFFPKINKDVGMSGVLAGQIDLAKVIQKTKVDGLHVICAGAKAPNPSELLHEAELNKIMSKLSEHYDRIIVDSAPILPVSDTRLLVKHVQTVVLVVRALKAPVGAILRTKELLEQASAPIAGVVLNDMKREQRGRGYHYYGYKGYGEYGGYGGYGGYYEDDK